MKTKSKGILMLLLAFVVQFSFAQEKIITGVVKDDLGPVADISVVVKGTQKGTVTDFDGKFSIKAKKGDVLVFSHVSYEPVEVKVGDSNYIEVTLKDSGVQLDEIIVRGYGTVNQRDLTTNISKADIQTVKNVSTANIGAALQGASTGVQVSQASGAPGGQVNIRIRGASSILGSNNPLFVVDGVPMITGSTLSDSYGGQRNDALSNLNSDDIESVEVLKDAASAAIYGTRGSNGVILITTKKGKSGEAKFNFSNTIGLQNPIRKYEMMNFGQWLKFGDAYYENSGQPSGFWSGIWTGNANLIGASQQDLETFYVDNYDTGDNYLDYVYVDNAVVTNTNFNISGGTNKTKYYLGVSNFDQKGVIRSQDYQRKNIRLNLSQDLTDKLVFSGGISLSDEKMSVISNDNNIYGVLSTGILESPGNDIYNADGSFNSTDFIFSNPLQNALEDFGKGRSFRVFGNGKLLYKINDDFSIGSRYGLDKLEFQERLYNPPTSAQGSPDGFAEQRHTTRTKYTFLQSLNFNHTYTKFKVRAFAGFEYERNTTSFLRAASNGFTSPLLTYVSEGSTPLNADASFSEENRMSFISRFGTTYNNTLILELSLRADASSKFSKDNRWGIFPAASLAYIISSADWFDSKIIDFLKLRASWGVTGNDSAIGRYSYQPSVAVSTYGDQSATYLTLANPDLRWEETQQVDVGFEVKFLDNRLGLTYSYYKKQTKDNSLILNKPNALNQGGGSIPANIGEMVNKGHEIDFNAIIVNNDSFYWNSSLGISTLDNEVTSLGGSAPFDTGFVNRVEEGAALGAFRLLETDGLYQDISEVPATLQAQGVGPGDVKYIDQNGDGIINDDDYIIAGNYFADYIINFKNSFKYKNLDLNFLITKSVGNDVFNNNLQFAGASGNRIFNKFVSQLDYWTPTNTDTDLPRPNLNTQSYNNQDGTRLLEDGSFVKLRNITLGYNIKSIPKIDNLRLTLSADNLIVITDYSGVDPEVSAFGSQSVQGGTDFLTQGGNKVWKFGVNITF